MFKTISLNIKLINRLEFVLSNAVISVKHYKFTQPHFENVKISI